MKSAVAVIVGSFNPVQKAHIYLGQNVLQQFPQIRKVIYVPVSNMYQKGELLDSEYRYQILRAACNSLEQFQVSRVEIDEKKQLYTYQTMALLQQRYPNDELYLVIGSDNLKEFDTWKHYRTILRRYHLIVFTRNQDNLAEFMKSNPNIAKYQDRIFLILNNQYLHVSSTEVRRRIQLGLDFQDLVPEEVYQYLKKDNRYQIEKEKRVC